MCASQLVLFFTSIFVHGSFSKQISMLVISQGVFGQVVLFWRSCQVNSNWSGSIFIILPTSIHILTPLVSSSIYPFNLMESSCFNISCCLISSYLAVYIISRLLLVYLLYLIFFPLEVKIFKLLYYLLLT